MEDPRRSALTLAAVMMAMLLAAGPAAADGIMHIPAGAFWMGRDEGSFSEAPAHRVFLPDFWIDRHKVTNAEFAEFLNARGLRNADGQRAFDDDDADARIHYRESRWTVDAGYERHPAVEASWFGARDYCVWRGRRLPTEAEWEKAARGVDRRLYPWGTAPPSAERAVFGRGYNATAPADGRPAGASPYGVEDLLGNLREWTSSEYHAYPYRRDDGRENGGHAATRVVRGAAHDDSGESLSITTRRFYELRGLQAGHHHVGFRCATSEDLGEIATHGGRQR
jgi:formylglycine-generating enzyme required for sulfatase activity